MAGDFKINMNQEAPEDLLNLRGHPVAYFPKYAQILGGVTAALFISQLHYWRLRSRDPDGWIYRTMEQLTEETGLTKSEQRTARKILTEAELLTEEKRGMPAKNFYRVDWGRLVNLLLERDHKTCVKRMTSDEVNASQDMRETNHLLYKETHKETHKDIDTWVDVIIREINSLTKRSYRPDSKITNKDLRKRLSDGATLDDALLVIRDRWQRWKDKPEMREHLNPQTLFRPSHFERYLVEARASGGDKISSVKEGEKFRKFIKNHRT